MTEEQSRSSQVDWVADLLGFAVAAFFTLLLGGVVSGIIAAVARGMGITGGNTVSSPTVTLAVVGLVAGLVAVFVAYLIGGYTAGRLAQIHGLRNGIGVVLWSVLAAVIFGVVGVVVGQQTALTPPWHGVANPTSLTVGGVIGLLAALLTMLLGAGLGGEWGERYRGIQHLAASAVVPADGPAGQVRDLGDVIEIPVVEEVLVKQPVVKEVVRVRKRPVVEEHTVAGDVRRESVQVEREGSADTGTDVE